MNSENLRSIQSFKEKVESAGSPRVWFAAGVILNVGLMGSFLLYLALRRRRTCEEMQRTIHKYILTEDGQKPEGGIVNKPSSSHSLSN